LKSSELILKTVSYTGSILRRRKLVFWQIPVLYLFVTFLSCFSELVGLQTPCVWAAVRSPGTRESRQFQAAFF
jgi:hypothetical protein